MIGEREKEFEDGLFFGALASEQKRSGSAEPEKVHQFAGLTFDTSSIPVEEL